MNELDRFGGTGAGGASRPRGRRRGNSKLRASFEMRRNRNSQVLAAVRCERLNPRFFDARAAGSLLHRTSDEPFPTHAPSPKVTLPRTTTSLCSSDQMEPTQPTPVLPWTAAEDARLLELVTPLRSSPAGSLTFAHWLMLTHSFPGRTPAAIQTHWWLLSHRLSGGLFIHPSAVTSN